MPQVQICLHPLSTLIEPADHPTHRRCAYERHRPGRSTGGGVEYAVHD
jgi:hypothetical protein